MKCDYCSKNIVYHRKLSNEKVCKKHFIITVEKKIWRTVRKNNLFTPREKVVVGVSGGKDSLVMLYNVKKLQDRYPKGPKVEAILVDEGIAGYRGESIKIAREICKKWKVPIKIVSFQSKFGFNLDDLIEKLHQYKMNACTICGTVRRRLLNDTARELNADKIAIGHNIDDQAQTFLANILRNDIKKIMLNKPSGQKKDVSDFLIPRVKPLIEIPENEIVLYSYYKGIPLQTTPCPYIKGFSILRKKIQTFLNTLEDNSPEIKYNLLRANQELFKKLNQQPIRKEKPKIEKKINHCSICHSPCGKNRDICYYCELKEKFT